MNAPIKDLGAYLVTNAPSDTPLVEATNLFYGQIPESAGLSVALLDGAGSPPDQLTSTTDINNPGIQVMARGTLGGYLAAYNLISTVVDLLHGISNTTIGSVSYIRCQKMNEPIAIGYDSTNRPILTCHLAVKRSA